MLYFFSPRFPRDIYSGWSSLYKKPHHPVGPGKTPAVEFLETFASLLMGLILSTIPFSMWGSDWFPIGFRLGFRLGSDWVPDWVPIGFRLGSDWVPDWVPIGFRLVSVYYSRLTQWAGVYATHKEMQ